MANKRIHFALLGTLILAAAAVFCIVSQSKAQLDSVSNAGLRVEWSSGDVKAAEGFSFTYNENSSNLLGWANTISFGKNGEEYSSKLYKDSPVVVNNADSVDFHAMTMTDSPELEAYFQKLLDEMKPGESKEVDLYLKDLYSFYPIWFNWYVAGDFYNYGFNHSSLNEKLSELAAKIQSMIKVPVGEDDRIRLDLAKHTGGASYGSEEVKVARRSVSGYLLGDHVYCVVAAKNDPSAEPGVYRFSIKKQDKETQAGGGHYNYIPDSGLDPVWAFPEGGDWRGTRVSKDRSAMFVFYTDGSGDYVLVISQEGKKLQTIGFRDRQADIHSDSLTLYPGEDHMIAAASEAMYCFYPEGGEFKLKKFPGADFGELSGGAKLVPDMVLFDGDRLAAAGISGGMGLSDWNYNAHYKGVYFAVLSESGPVYQAKYRSDSLDAEYYMDEVPSADSDNGSKYRRPDLVPVLLSLEVPYR